MNRLFLLLAPLLALFVLAGCATSESSTFHPLQPLPAPATPLRLAVLPPTVSPTLSPEEFKPTNPWYERWLLDGRGNIVTANLPVPEIHDQLVATLSVANVAVNVFPAKDREEAIRLGADRVVACQVYDYRTVLLGGNRSFAWVFVAGPLFPQYWLPCMTLEARLDWDVQLEDLHTGRLLYRQRIPRTYTRTVRYAFGQRFTNKMHNFLRYDASPEYIGEILGLPPFPPLPGTVALPRPAPPPPEPDISLAPR